MSHGENAERGGHAGKEYWKSRLYRGGEIPGWFTKWLTHRKERREARRMVREAEYDEYPMDEFRGEVAMRVFMTGRPHVANLQPDGKWEIREVTP